MYLMICNILRGPVGSVADINGRSLGSLIRDQSSVTILVLPCCIFFVSLRLSRIEFNCCSGSHECWCVSRPTGGNLSKSLIVYSLHWNIKGTERGMAYCGASVEGPLLMKVLVCECVLDDMSVWGGTWALLWPVRGDYEGGSLLRRACRGETDWAFRQDFGGTGSQLFWKPADLM